MNKKYITEGTWAFPRGVDGLRELKELLDNPVPVKDATKMIYNIVGDDSLFDELGNMAELNPDQDARGIICNKICKMIEDGGFYEDDNYRDEIYNFCRAIGKGTYETI